MYELKNTSYRAWTKSHRIEVRIVLFICYTVETAMTSIFGCTESNFLSYIRYQGKILWRELLEFICKCTFPKLKRSKLPAQTYWTFTWACFKFWSIIYSSHRFIKQVMGPMKNLLLQNKKYSALILSFFKNL